VNADPAFAAAESTALQQRLDDDTDDLHDIEAYAEASFGVLF
jgi:hypothetical protein